MYRWMGSLLAMMVVMGAAEADDLGKQYADYDLAFRDRHKPTIHAIPRGPMRFMRASTLPAKPRRVVRRSFSCTGFQIAFISTTVSHRYSRNKIAS